MLIDLTVRPARFETGLRALLDPDWRLARRAEEGKDYTAQPVGYQKSAGVGVVDIFGPMSKDPLMGFFGGAWTTGIESAILRAASDPEVGSILLRIDSPGGEAAGIEDLADAVWRVRKAGVPVHAHIEDLGASAAYWTASQADTITANGTAEVGSIGTIAGLEVIAEALKDRGIAVHMVAVPEGKGTLARASYEGTGVDAAKDYIRERIEPMTAAFTLAVRRGRGRDAAWGKSVTQGRVWDARTALEMGLIDGIADKHSALGAASRAAATTLKARDMRRAERVGKRAAVAVRLREGGLAP